MTALRTAPSILIRSARDSDAADLEALAELDSSVVPAGRLLVAEADGEVVAALAPASGERIANPFKPTAEIVSLLELRAGRTRTRRERRSHNRIALRGAPRTRLA